MFDLAFWVKCGIVFTAVTVADVFWTLYTIEVGKRNALKASVWSVAIVLCGVVSIISYTTDHRLIVPAALGAFVGTYVAIKFSKKES